MTTKKHNLYLCFFLSILFITVIPTDNQFALSNDAEPEIMSQSDIDVGWQTGDNWHLGTDLTTDEVDVTYSVEFQEDKNCIYQWCKFTYPPESPSFTPEVAFRFTLTFNDGAGVDWESETVTDWNELDLITPTLTTDAKIPDGANLGDMSHSERYFNGFEIYNGTADDINISQFEEDTYMGYRPDQNRYLGFIKFTSSPIRLGEVTLDTEPYTTIKGVSSTKSIAEFRVSINATMGTSTDNETVPAYLDFNINRTVDFTRYKYGVDVNWSNVKDFPTELPMDEGDSFSLVAADDLQFCYYENDETKEVFTFDINPTNDTAKITKNGFTLSTNHFTTEYDVFNESGSMHMETKRFYYRQANMDFADRVNRSKVFVVYDGFEYNVSEKLVFDPTFSVFSDGVFGSNDPAQWWIIGLILGGLIGVGVLTLFIQRRKRM